MEKTSLIRYKPTLGHDNNALTWLIIINAVIFVMANFVKVVMFLSADDAAQALNSFHNDVMINITLPGGFADFLHRPWTLLTYMFTHESFFYIFSSLLWLWLFGSIFQDMVGTDKIIPLYIYGGLAGGIIFLLASNLVPAFARNAAFSGAMMGGNAAIMAIAISTTTLFPSYKFLPSFNGGISLWIVALVFVAVDYASIATTNGSFALAHLGGAFMGFVFASQLKKGRNMGKWMSTSFNYVNDLCNPDKKKPVAANPVQNELFYHAEKEPFAKQILPSQEHLDEILDKINQTGYVSLSEEEKVFLTKYSEQNN